MDFPDLSIFNNPKASTPPPPPIPSAGMFAAKVGKPLESILIADCGSNTTRVVLVDVVDNAYRFVARSEAPSTLEAPYADVTIGVLNAIAGIEATTGRRLLVGGQLLTPQQENGSGVDAFVASSSAAEALQVVAAGLVRDLSVATCARASHGTYTTILDTISLDDYGEDFDENSASNFDPELEFSPFAAGSIMREAAINAQEDDGKKKKGIKFIDNRHRQFWRERQIARLRQLKPNVIVMSGGNDKVIEPLLRIVDVILEANHQESILATATGDYHRPPTLVFAGNTDAQEAVIERIAGQVEFFGIDNIRPGGVIENMYPLQRQLSALYQERLLPTLPGFNHLTEISNASVNTTCNAVGLMTQFLAHDVANNQVLTADIGGANSALFYADSADFISMVRGNFGLSYGLSNVLAEVGAETVTRWLPFDARPDEVINYALNKTLRPQVLPADDRELMIEAAFVREALQLLYRELRSQSSKNLDFNRLIGVGGPLVNVNPWQAALALLDGIQPMGSKTTGLVEMELDSTTLMAAAGALAAYDANAATYIFHYDCLNRLGPCIVPIGDAAIGSKAVRVTLTTRDGRKRTAEVPFGSISILPLRADEQASLEIVPTNNFRIGSARRGAIVRTEPGQEVTGGLVGLIIDARGRPLKLATAPQARIQQLLNWQKAYAEMLTMAENEVAAMGMPVASAPVVAAARFAATAPTPAKPKKADAAKVVVPAPPKGAAAPSRIAAASAKKPMQTPPPMQSSNQAPVPAPVQTDADDMLDALRGDKGKNDKSKKNKKASKKDEKPDGPERIGLTRRK